jgi:hypothetical protein
VLLIGRYTNQGRALRKIQPNDAQEKTMVELETTPESDTLVVLDKGERLGTITFDAQLSAWMPMRRGSRARVHPSRVRSRLWKPYGSRGPRLRCSIRDVQLVNRSDYASSAERLIARRGLPELLAVIAAGSSYPEAR